MDEPDDVVSEKNDLEAARLLSGLGRFEMWIRYFSLGGRASPLELDALFNQSLVFSASEYNIAVQALNERLTEIGLEPMVEPR